MDLRQLVKSFIGQDWDPVHPIYDELSGTERVQVFLEK